MTRNEIIVQELLNNPNTTYAEMGLCFGISRQRVQEIFKKRTGVLRGYYNRPVTDYYMVDEVTGCWIGTTGGRQTSTIYFNGKWFSLRKYLYEQKHGIKVTTPLYTRCGNTKCVNPDHICTAQFGRTSKLRRNMSLISDYNNGARVTDLAEYYGISIPNVVKILNRYAKESNVRITCNGT